MITKKKEGGQISAAVGTCACAEVVGMQVADSA